ncbi:UNVERIFIED_CONTAM: hypothetical protein K2H54_012017 [Gekko kuhli]
MKPEKEQETAGRHARQARPAHQKGEGAKVWDMEVAGFGLAPALGWRLFRSTDLLSAAFSKRQPQRRGEESTFATAQ